MGNATIKRVFQIGIVVHDAVRAAKNFCQLFGIDEMEIQIIDVRKTGSPPMRYMGAGNCGLQYYSDDSSG